MPYSYRLTSHVLYSAQYHRQNSTLHAYEQFGTLHMHNPMTNIRPSRDSNSVRLSSQLQLERMNHQGRPRGLEP